MARLSMILGLLVTMVTPLCRAQGTTGYFLNDCPKATGADYAL